MEFKFVCPTNISSVDSNFQMPTITAESQDNKTLLFIRREQWKSLKKNKDH